MKRLSLVVSAILVASAAGAHRQPSPGRGVTLALPPDLTERTVEAHLFLPLVERMGDRSYIERLAHPALQGHPGWRSLVLREVRSTREGKRWILRPTSAASAQTLARALSRCLKPASDERGSWTAAALRAADVNAEAKALGDGSVEVAFSRSVGPLLELLEGCALRTRSNTPTGAFEVHAAGGLGPRAGAPGGAPLLERMDLRRPGTGPADLVLSGPEGRGSATLAAPVPDVVLLTQSASARAEDPLQFGAASRLSEFRAALGADLLLAVYWAGQGRQADGILPPGVAPARPLPQEEALGNAPLALGPLAMDAPRLTVSAAVEGDALLGGVTDRLAVILRSRGLGLRNARTEAGERAQIEIFRWRAPTLDPALALLALAGERPTLTNGDLAEAVRDPRLLSSDPEERLMGAMALERRWIDERLVVPLMTADRWYAIDPALRGVRIRADGVPLLEDAHWGLRR